jgi:hypothetical protein
VSNVTAQKETGAAMKDSDIDSLSADGAQDTGRMTDPRAALAEYLGAEAAHAALIIEYLAERGVLLVTVGGLQDAIQTVALHDPSRITSTEYATAIFAALSGEADGY